MFDFTPDPVALQLGPIPILWYGIGYALGLAVAYLVMVRLAQRAGEDADVLGNAIIIVAVAALIGGRAYHVIDQWALYKDDPLKIFLPPYSGLGVYGGIATGTIAAFLYARYKRLSFLRWADIVAPGLFVMQGIARWGNFFNQELYGSPTTLPWGIAIDCAHRVAAYACPPGSDPTSSLGQHFQPLFLYESLSGLLGAAILIWLGFHARRWLRAGDLLLLFFVWYGIIRFVLESLRADNWTFFGVPMAQIVSILVVVPALAILAWRHRPGHPLDAPPSRPSVATWGAIGRPVEPGDEVDDVDDDDGDDDEYDDEDGDDEYDDEDGDEVDEDEGDLEDDDHDEEGELDDEDELASAPGRDPGSGPDPATEPSVDPPGGAGASPQTA